MYDVYVARLGGTTYAVRSNGRVIAKVPSGTDCSRLLKAAVDAVPNGGSLNIRGGTYVVKAPYAILLAAPLLRVDVLGLVKRVI